MADSGEEPRTGFSRFTVPNNAQVSSVSSEESHRQASPRICIDDVLKMLQFATRRTDIQFNESRMHFRRARAEGADRDTIDDIEDRMERYEDELRGLQLLDQRLQQFKRLHDWEEAEYQRELQELKRKREENAERTGEERSESDEDLARKEKELASSRDGPLQLSLRRWKKLKYIPGGAYDRVEEMAWKKLAMELADTPSLHATPESYSVVEKKYAAKRTVDGANEPDCAESPPSSSSSPSSISPPVNRDDGSGQVVFWPVWLVGWRPWENILQVQE